MQLEKTFFFKSKNLIPPWEYFKTSLDPNVNNQHIKLSNLPTAYRGLNKFRTAKFKGLDTLRCPEAIQTGSSFDLLSPYLEIYSSESSFHNNVDSLIPPPAMLPCQKPHLSHLHSTRPVVDQVPLSILNERGVFRLNNSPLTSPQVLLPHPLFRDRFNGDYRNCYEPAAYTFPNTNFECTCLLHKFPVPEAHPGFFMSFYGQK
jgi:hypothetical protein